MSPLFHCSAMLIRQVIPVLPSSYIMKKVLTPTCYQDTVRPYLIVQRTARYCWRTSFKVLGVRFLGKFPQLFCIPRRHVGHTNFGTFEFANSIGTLFATLDFQQTEKMAKIAVFLANTGKTRSCNALEGLRKNKPERFAILF